MSLSDNITIGCIGTGNMGGTIIKGLSRHVKKRNIAAFDADGAKLARIKEETGVETAESPADLAGRCDIILIAVKPDAVPQVLLGIRDALAGKITISIAAGITLHALEEMLSAQYKIIRVMPNTPALVGEGMTVISPNKNVDEDSLASAVNIFSLLGKTVVLPEKHMDAVTAVSGCGPAYGFTLIQAMAEGGVKMGIPRDIAMLLSAQTILGAAKMVLDGGEEPSVLRGRVASPGGSTIEAVHVFEKAGFSGIVMDAIEAAAIKSEKLGKKK